MVFGKTELTNETYGLYIIYYYSSRMLTWNTQPYLKEDLLILSGYFKLFSVIVHVSIKPFFKLWCTDNHHVYNLYRIFYTLIFDYVMSYIMSEICIGRRFLEDCFYCYALWIISAVAKNPWFPMTLYKEHQKQRTFGTVTPNATSNEILKM